MTESKKNWLLGLVLIAITFVAYASSFRNNYIWDDDKYLYANPLISQKGFVGLQSIWLDSRATPQYYPLVFTSYWIEYRLWGLDPLGYHVVNILLHAFSALLVWRVMVRLKVPGPWMIAAVFAVHPVMVESVAWVTERKNTLSLVFYLLALHSWMRYCPLDRDLRASRRQWGWYGATILFFIAALLSKTVACTLPAAIALLIFWKRHAIHWRDLVSLLPLFVLGVLMGLQTAALEQHHVGATGSQWNFSFGERCLIAGNVATFYFIKLLAPSELTFIYPRWTIDAFDPLYYLGPAFVLTMTISLTAARKRIGLSPLTAWLFFIGTLFPALGFFNVYPFRYSFVADHFQYHASIGAIALVVGSACWLMHKVFHDRGKTVPVTLGGVALLGMAAITFSHATIFRDEQTLWEDTIAKNPEAWIAHNNLGQIYQRQVDLERARQRFEDAARLAPDVIETRMNFGNALLDLDQPTRAIREFKAATEIDSRRAAPYVSLGLAQRRLGQIDDARANFAFAREVYRKIIQQRIADGLTWYGLGRAEQGLDDHDAAIKALSIVLAVETDHEGRAELLCLIAASHLATGRDAMAVSLLEGALKESPQHFDASLRLALAFASSENPAVRDGIRAHAIARELCIRVGSRSPRYVLCIRALTAAYAEIGDFERAEEAARLGAELAKKWHFETLPERFELRAENYRQKKVTRLTGDQWIW